MPTDHAEVTLTDVRVADSTRLGDEGRGLAVAQTFVHENRIRQAASGVGASQYCIDESVKYARERKPFGKPLSINQAIQWPLAEMHTEAEMIRQLVRKTAWEMDQGIDPMYISDKVAMCNYRANRLVCQAADQAIQTHGGIGYSRHMPFEHIYRHHRRYRITEGRRRSRSAGWLSSSSVSPGLARSRSARASPAASTPSNAAPPPPGNPLPSTGGSSNASESASRSPPASSAARRKSVSERSERHGPG